MEKKERPFINSYLAGFLLGMVLLLAFYLTGRGLGASGASKSIVVATVKNVAPEHAENTTYYSSYIEKRNGKPIKSWLFYEVLGVLIGGFISGLFSGRLKFRIEKGPNLKSSLRLLAAVVGGLLFGLGSQFGYGCTSGAALSGMAVLSTAGFISMMTIFGSGYVFAWFFRKLWI